MKTSSLKKPKGGGSSTGTCPREPEGKAPGGRHCVPCVEDRTRDLVRAGRRGKTQRSRECNSGPEEGGRILNLKDQIHGEIKSEPAEAEHAMSAAHLK